MVWNDYIKLELGLIWFWVSTHIMIPIGCKKFRLEYNLVRLNVI